MSSVEHGRLTKVLANPLLQPCFVYTGKNFSNSASLTERRSNSDTKRFNIIFTDTKNESLCECQQSCSRHKCVSLSRKIQLNTSSFPQPNSRISANTGEFTDTQTLTTTTKYLVDTKFHFLNICVST